MVTCFANSLQHQGFCELLLGRREEKRTVWPFRTHSATGPLSSRIESAGIHKKHPIGTSRHPVDLVLMLAFKRIHAVSSVERLVLLAIFTIGHFRVTEGRSFRKRRVPAFQNLDFFGGKLAALQCALIQRPALSYFSLFEINLS